MKVTNIYISFLKPFDYRSMKELGIFNLKKGPNIRDNFVPSVNLLHQKTTLLNYNIQRVNLFP